MHVASSYMVVKKVKSESLNRVPFVCLAPELEETFTTKKEGLELEYK
jgi:hypothetical protein